MEKRQKDKSDDVAVLRELISTEFNLIKTSETMSGALTHLGFLFTKLQRLSNINRIIALAEAELAEEDRSWFENLEKAVTWLHEKIRILLPHAQWEPDSFAMAEVKALLSFATISLNASGYVGSLLFALKHLFSEVAQEEKNYPLFDGWAQIENSTNHFVIYWPECIDRSLNALPIEQQVYQWKERADTSLSCLLRFLKILILYPTFVPLVLPNHPTIDCLPKNLRELEERQCQAYVGCYLSSFRSTDPKKHPLSNTELVKLVERFLYMLEQKIESDLLGTTTIRREPVNVVINQFLFFTPSSLKEDEMTTATQPSPPTSNQEETLSKQGHWRSEQCKQDVAAVIPYAQKIWVEAMASELHPMKIGKEKLANELLNRLPSYISLHSKGDKRLPRALKAIVSTDPRIFERGCYKGLKPHWEEFA